MREDPSYRLLMDYALRALSRRSHTVHELRAKLQKRAHHTLEYEEAIIKRLLELKLLDDQAYIQRSIEQATEFKLHGPRKIAEHLYRKGIPFQTTKKLWDQMKISEYAIAKKALKKKAKDYKTLPPTKRYEKQARFLASRGFSPEIVFELAKIEENS